MLMTTLSAADRQILRTLGEVKALSDAEFSGGAEFSVTGSVVASVLPFGYILDDNGSRQKILFLTNSTPELGDVIALTGHTSISRRSARLLTATGWEFIRRGPLPTPEEVTIEQILNGSHNLHLVKTAGNVIDFFLDDLDRRFAHIFLSDQGKTLDIGIKRDAFDHSFLRSLVNARVSVTGTCVPSTVGWRMHTGPILLGISKIDVLAPAPDDPFDVEPLDPIHHLGPDSIVKMGRRFATGEVTAVWHGDRFLISTDSGTRIRAQLVSGQKAPVCGDFVRVVGLADTDTANIMLTSALWRHEKGARRPIGKPRAITPGDLKRTDFHSTFDGNPVTITGEVTDLHGVGTPTGQMLLDCGGTTFTIDISGISEWPGRISTGCRIRVDGVFIAETDAWSRNLPFPRFKGFFIVPSGVESMALLSSPRWWTPGRLLAIIITLLIALMTILIWNRILRLLIEKRSRQLLKEQVARVESELRIEERTRLAVELHDSISQNLTGVTLEINTANRVADTDAVKMHHHLDIAVKALNSCRNELRNCIWDLRSRALEATDMDTAIRQTLAPHIRDAALSIRFNVPREKISDNTAHTILRIIRELTVNALRHGDATAIRVAGSIENGRLLFSVRDNGRGFDPETAPGVVQGHFGLLGIRERVENSEGEMRIESSPGKGTKTTIILNVPPSVQEEGSRR